MNVLIIAVDTLRADHLGCYGYERNTSPNIDAFSESSALIERCIATAIPTHPAFVTINTGQYSITHGVVSHGGAKPIPRGIPWLPNVFQSNGYTTCAVDNLADWRHGFGRGYEFYIDPTSKRNLAINCDNRAINQRAIPWLKDHAQEKFFMFVHYWDPHTPYLPPRAYRKLFYRNNPDQTDNHIMDKLASHPLGQMWTETWFSKLEHKVTDPEYIVALYDGEIRYCDEGIAQLLKTLDETGQRENTLVVFLSDHGELMYQHGIFFDHHGLYEGNLHVPLVFNHPGIQPRRMNNLFAQVDIAPTILGLTEIEIPDTMEGYNWAPCLLGKDAPPLRDFIVSQECTWQMKWSIHTESHKFIKAREEDYYGTPMRELYDLRQDPIELNNLADSEPEVAAELEQTLEMWVSTKMAENGLTEDPLIASGLTLGEKWKKERVKV